MRCECFLAFLPLLWAATQYQGGAGGTASQPQRPDSYAHNGGGQHGNVPNSYTQQASMPPPPQRPSVPSPSSPYNNGPTQNGQSLDVNRGGATNSQYSANTPQRPNDALGYTSPPTVLPDSYQHNGNAHAQSHDSRHIQETHQNMEMTSHSFTGTIATDQTGKDGNWLFAGSALPTLPDRVLVTPSTQNRFGMVFHRRPVNSLDFDINMDFKIQGELMQGQGFGVWYVKEDVAKTYETNDPMRIFDKQEASWDTLLRNANLDFYGFRNRFEGFGILFREVNNMPAVHCIQDKNIGATRHLNNPNFVRFDNKDFTLQVRNLLGVIFGV